MNIVYVFADAIEDENTAEWRCAIPARAINRTSLHSAALISMESFARNTPEAKSTIEGSDIIIVQRNLYGQVLNAIQYWKARNKTIVADFDESFDMLPQELKSRDFWESGVQTKIGPENLPIISRIEPSPLTQFKLGLRLVHAATVPSTTLMNDWAEFTTVYHLPSYIDIDRYTQVTSETHEGIIIGWGGGPSHLHNFVESGILQALENVCENRSNVKVMICGDYRIFKLLPVPEDQKFFQPWVSAAEWPRQLARFDIGLAPLTSAFDQRRSWIKVLEYLVMKIPWIASEGPAYHALRSYGWMVSNNAMAWERILIDMIDHIEDYKHEAARDAYLFGIGQSIDDNIEKIIKIYSQIIEKSKA